MAPNCGTCSGSRQEEQAVQEINGIELQMNWLNSQRVQLCACGKSKKALDDCVASLRPATVSIRLSFGSVKRLPKGIFLDAAQHPNPVKLFWSTATLGGVPALILTMPAGLASSQMGD